MYKKESIPPPTHTAPGMRQGVCNAPRLQPIENVSCAALRHRYHLYCKCIMKIHECMCIKIFIYIHSYITHTHTHTHTCVYSPAFGDCQNLSLSRHCLSHCQSESDPTPRGL